MSLFDDRSHAGRELSNFIQDRTTVDLVVIPYLEALEVGIEIARENNAEVNIMLADYLYNPDTPYCEIGAVVEDGRAPNTALEESGSFLDAGLNYSMIIPHGIELEYNPAIEMVCGDKQEAVDSYEDKLIGFLKQAESANAGYNYVLLSSHYVNTPFRPRYVKKDELFQDINSEGWMGVEDILEFYREKEISKIESLASKISDLSIPRVSEELMDKSERKELGNFIYGFEDLEEGVWQNKDYVKEDLGLSPEIERPGVYVVGAHPTLIERNEIFMDYFREKQGLTAEDISNGVYPEEALREYYQPMVETANSENNFIFEINGKAVERQHPSVFWEMLDEFVFGSDSHRLGEQPSRSEEFINRNIPGETVFLAEKWARN